MESARRLYYCKKLLDLELTLKSILYLFEWVIIRKLVIALITGSRKLNRIGENIKDSNIELTKEELRKIGGALDNLELKADNCDPNSSNAKRVDK